MKWLSQCQPTATRTLACGMPHHSGLSRSPAQCVSATRYPRLPRLSVWSSRLSRDALTDSARFGWSLAFGSSPAGGRGTEGGWKRAMRATRSCRWTSEGRLAARALSESGRGMRGGRRHRERRRLLKRAGEASRYHRRGQNSRVSIAASCGSGRDKPP